MATTRRGIRRPRSTSRQGRSTPPPYSDEVMDRQQTDEELSPAESSTRGLRSRGSGGSSNNRHTPPEDSTDGTTQWLPHSTSTTPPGRPGSSTLHTSGHTQCRSRTTNATVPPRRPTTTRDEEEELGKEVREQEGRGNATYTSKKHQTHHHSHSPHSHHQGPTAALLIFICLLTLALIYSLHQSLSRMKEEERARKKAKPIAQVYDDLKFELQSLNREFSQPREVWLGLLGQLEAVMVEEPPQPAVLLLVVPDDSRGAATCLVHHLATAVQNAFEDSRFVMFDTRSSEHLGDNAALKLDLDHTLGGLAQVHAAVVHNVESLPGHAAMILHAYCDNENAPFKQAIIFLLAEVPGRYKDLAYSRLDSVVDSQLLEAWGGGDKAEGEAEEGEAGDDSSNSVSGRLKEKDVSALISRTANTPILVRPEPRARMMEMCPV